MTNDIAFSEGRKALIVSYGVGEVQSNIVIFSRGGEVEGGDGEGVGGIPILGHKKLEFFFNNLKIYIGIVKSLRQIETYFFFKSKGPVFL